MDVARMKGWGIMLLWVYIKQANPAKLGPNRPSQWQWLFGPACGCDKAMRPQLFSQSLNHPATLHKPFEFKWSVVWSPNLKNCQHSTFACNFRGQKSINNYLISWVVLTCFLSLCWRVAKLKVFRCQVTLLGRFPQTHGRHQLPRISRTTHFAPTLLL